RTLEGMRESFEHNLLPLMRSHPETEFDLVWPPYSILVWVDFAQRTQLDVTFAFKRYVAEAAADLANVHVIDLQAAAAITHDLDRYDDIYHFDPAVNEWLVDAACHDRDRVDALSAAAYETALREQLRALDLGTLAAKGPERAPVRALQPT